MNFKSDKELQKMKKVELIDYIKQLHQDSEEKSANILKLIADCTFAESRAEELEEELKARNDRGAGRKKKFDDKVVSQIIQARKENKSIRTIAKEFNCSIGLIQKIINENKK